MVERKSSMDVNKITVKAAERVFVAIYRRCFQQGWGTHPDMPMIQDALDNINDALRQQMRNRAPEPIE